jgi:hypothetical protein
VPDDSWKWQNTDPRDSINELAQIIIVRPNTQSNHGEELGQGFVDTKEGWYIHTTFEDHPSIHADDKWDPIWRWIFWPD